MGKRKNGRSKKKKLPLLNIILTIATIFGAGIAALMLLPRVVVDSSVPVDPSNPLSSSFTIINTGYIPLGDINVSIGIGQIVTEPAQIDPNFIPSFNSRLIRPEWMHHRLSMDDRFTITIGDIFSLGPSIRLSGADIAIVVSYNPWFIPIKKEKVLRYVTKKQTDGRLYWYSRPIQ